MPDNWAYVFAAYGLAAFVLAAYWRYLARRERELTALADRTRPPAGRTPAAGGGGSPPRSPVSTSVGRQGP